MPGYRDRLAAAPGDVRAARELARCGAWACAAAAFMIGLRAGAGLISAQAYGAPAAWGVPASVLFVVLAVLIWRQSLRAALLAPVLWLACWPLGLYRHVTLFSGLLLIATGLFFVLGVRGALALRRLRAAEPRI